MAQFTIYQNTEASAPQLSGQNDSLLTLLDAILVNGYGTQPAAGWTIAGTALNRRAYKMGGVGSTGFCLSINDNAVGAGGPQEATVAGLEHCTGAIQGTGWFPLALTNPANVIRKSATADTTNRAWTCFADSRTIYLFILSGDNAGYYMGMLFGDFYTFSPTDQWNCMIIGDATQNSGSPSSDQCATANVPTTAIPSHFLARTWNGSNPGNVTASKHGDSCKGGNSVVVAFGQSGSGLPVPNAADGSLYLSPIWITEAVSGVVRGTLRGLWHLCHSCTSFASQATFVGQGDFAGRTFQMIRYLGGSNGCLVIETSNTLLTNSPVAH
jgi:hypothetical protein